MEINIYMAVLKDFNIMEGQTGQRNEHGLHPGFLLDIIYLYNYILNLSFWIFFPQCY